MCYFCAKTSNEDTDILHHELMYHMTGEPNFSIRVKGIDENTGDVIYRSQHYHVKLSDIKDWLDSGDKLTINTTKVILQFKRTSKDLVVDESDTREDTEENTDKGNDEDMEDKFRQLLPEVIDFLKETDRSDDFVSVLECILNGKINVRNIALNLLLDLGQYLNQSSSGQMRYSQTSLDFWLIIKKMFKGKGIQFFSGNMMNVVKHANYDADSNQATESSINFAAPSDKILRRENQKYMISGEKPGIIPGALTSFRESKSTTNPVECKIAIDGKKLAYGQNGPRVKATHTYSKNCKCKYSNKLEM